MNSKKLIALVLSLIIILSISPINMLIEVFAGLSPYDPELYGKGTYTDPVDYKNLYPDRFGVPNKISAPKAKFSVIKKIDGNIIGTSADDNTTVTKVESVPIGTTIKINNLSTVGTGSAIDMVDFQVTKSGSLVSEIQDKPIALSSYELTLNSTGTYNFYLCVRDNTDKTMTDGWGNWSYNGPHQATGLNNGKNGIKETSGTPEIAGGDDF